MGLNTMNIHNRIFKVEPNADGTVRLSLLYQNYEFDPSERKDRRGMILDYSLTARWVVIMPSTTEEMAKQEAKASWRMYPDSTKPPHRQVLL
jgi:transposase-like protein